MSIKFSLLICFNFCFPVLADAICNASGFGFNGYDEFGKPKWDLVSNVNWFKVEVVKLKCQ